MDQKKDFKMLIYSKKILKNVLLKNVLKSITILKKGDKSHSIIPPGFFWWYENLFTCFSKILFIFHKISCIFTNLNPVPLSLVLKWYFISFYTVSQKMSHSLLNLKSVVEVRHTWYLSFFLHSHIVSHENFTLGKCVNLR